MRKGSDARNYIISRHITNNSHTTTQHDLPLYLGFDEGCAVGNANARRLSASLIYLRARGLVTNG